MKRFVPAIATCLITALLCGCQTPPAVYELAEKSSSNTGVFQGHLEALSAQSAHLAKQRVDNIVVMQSGTTRLDAETRRELYMQQQSRTSTEWAEIDALMQRLVALRDRLIEIEESAVLAADQRRKDLLAQRKDIDTHKLALREAATALSALAEKESTEDRAKFLAGFARSVRADMKKVLDSGDATAAKAQALIDTVKAKTAHDAAPQPQP